MRLFKCQVCQQILYFENTVCEKCSSRLGYLPGALVLSTLQADGDAWQALAAPGKVYRYCANEAHGACNWLVDAGSSQTLCLSCRHNRTIPDLGVPDNLAGWRKIEAAKHRLFYSLVRLGLPLATRADDPTGLAFDVLADPVRNDAPRVMTGHDNGIITLALAEADDAQRDRAAAVDPLIERWIPLSVALNSLNRAMGQPDLYPFVLSAPVIDKLGLVRPQAAGGM